MKEGIFKKYILMFFYSFDIYLGIFFYIYESYFCFLFDYYLKATELGK